MSFITTTLPQWELDLARKAVTITSDLRPEADRFGQQLKKEAENAAPRATGELAGGHVIEVTDEGDTIRVELSNAVEHARFVHDGSVHNVPPRPWMTATLSALTKTGADVFERVADVGADI